jgi:hypothetical protein
VTSKRKRRRRSGQRTKSGSAGATPAEAISGEAVDETEEENPDAGVGRRRRGGMAAPRRGLASIPSPYPPFATSVSAGLRAAGSSPIILVVAFLGELAMWGLYAVLRVPVAAGQMAGLMALPPIHLLFDVRLVRVVSEGTAQLVLLALGIVAFRAILLGLLSLMIVDAVRDGAVSFPRALRRLPRAWAGLTQMYVIEVGLVLAAPILLAGLLGPQFGELGTILVLVFGLHFLVMTPVVIATEDARAPEALRSSARAARLPGLRHFGLVLTYFFLALFVLVPVTSVGLQPATPSFLVWVFVLIATLVHVGVLGAFAYRWLAVRDEPSLRGKAPARAKAGASAKAGGRKTPTNASATKATSAGKRKRRR